MTLQSTTLRPGLLVSLKTSLTGNVSYIKETIESDHKTEEGEQRAKWETTRTITDPEEHERAQKARAKAGSLIRSVCAHSAFGLLCPETDADKLDAAVNEARAITDAFNRSASLTRIGVYVITGRIAPDDAEAVRAINSEIADLMETMSRGIEELDVKTVREAASRAKDVGNMLPANVQERVQIAVDAARAAARKIVKAGEQAAQEIDTRAIRQITEARTAFLDLDGGSEIEQPAETGRAIDMEPAEPVTMKAAPEQAPLFDLN